MVLKYPGTGKYVFIQTRPALTRAGHDQVCVTLLAVKEGDHRQRNLWFLCSLALKEGWTLQSMILDYRQGPTWTGRCVTRTALCVVTLGPYYITVGSRIHAPVSDGLVRTAGAVELIRTQYLARYRFD